MFVVSEHPKISETLFLVVCFLFAVCCLLFVVIYVLVSVCYFWQISVKKDGDSVFIVSKHGTDGGKVVSHSKEVKRGRGKRNKFEQAAFNAESKWNDKVNKEAYEFVRDLQNAKPRIPTILFDDGSYLVEPTDLELSEKINSYLK